MFQGTADADKSTMIQQIQDFLNNCNGEQVRLLPDLCKPMFVLAARIKQKIITCDCQQYEFGCRHYLRAAISFSGIANIWKLSIE